MNGIAVDEHFHVSYDESIKIVSKMKCGQFRKNFNRDSVKGNKR